MLSDNQISALRASFPPEALSPDNSRGFELTSIKAAYIVERLNEVLGPCGCGWRYAHSPFEWIDGEVLTEVALQFKVAEGGYSAVLWDAQVNRWISIEEGAVWSLPIFAPGGRKPGRGTAPITDARKGAITDGLTKAASMIGVGHEVFKGLVRVSQQTTRANGQASSGFDSKTLPAKPNGQTPSNGSDSKPQSGNGQAPSNGHEARTNGQQPNGFEPRSQPVMPRRAIPTKVEPEGTTRPTATEPQKENDQAGATNFWLFANSDAARSLDRETASALAKAVIENRSTWTDALSKLKAMADGTATTKTLRLMETSDPLDMLFK